MEGKILNLLAANRKGVKNCNSETAKCAKLRERKMGEKVESRNREMRLTPDPFDRVKLSFLRDSLTTFPHYVFLFVASCLRVRPCLF
jgi:hypothetical protein